MAGDGATASLRSSYCQFELRGLGAQQGICYLTAVHPSGSLTRVTANEVLLRQLGPGGGLEYPFTVLQRGREIQNPLRPYHSTSKLPAKTENPPFPPWPDPLFVRAGLNWGLAAPGIWDMTT
ncbi:hypothetical protein S40285_10780 [Stachybotrys chlorohalonatus IBT 40285]|jgi:hypothetical protein|uniref:Uncharacterized protein n=1 Tax=Stachybotrys chlorohalonatus (strain IBT 40285) TaxID=1283841 RepID=A0A084Q813_STAC4|nr:hypothetical protein S40285_10780 [Stachybotrys chlorohalonata IBT 40285]